MKNIDSAIITLDEPGTATNNIIMMHQTQLQLQNSSLFSQQLFKDIFNSTPLPLTFAQSHL